MKTLQIIPLLRDGKIFYYIKDIALFILITLLVHRLWWNYDAYILSVPLFQNITDQLAFFAFKAGSWIDIHILRMNLRTFDNNIMLFNEKFYFYVNQSCSGFKQMFQVLFLFLLIPGPWKHKLWYIPTGMLSMIVVNVLRIVGLSYAVIWFPEHWDFIHMWVMRPLFYVWIFALWVIWEEKIRGKKEAEKEIVS